MKITKKNYFSLGIGNFYTVILCFKSWKINVYVISGHLTPNNVESKVSQPKIRNSDGNKPGNRIFCGLCLSFGAGNCHSTHPTMLLFLPLDMTFIFLVSDTLKSNSPKKLSFKNCFLLALGNLALLIYEYCRLTSWKEVVRRYSMRKTFLKNLAKSTTKYMYFIITPNNITSFSKVTG